jgi:hypothetical protein
VKLNKPSTGPSLKTHEGAPAANINTELQLRRAVLSCLLWEDTFYESGEDIADRIAGLAFKVSAAKVAALAIEARDQMHLRHVPLQLLSVLAETGSGSNLVSNTIERTIQRADELSEFLAIHAKRNKVGPNQIKKTLSKQIKVGLARAIRKFDAYQLGKYDRESAIKLRDVMFLVHPKPLTEAQAELFKKLAERNIEAPDTWEVALSAGGEKKTEADKKETWTRLLSEGKLGYMALLRNLRNMDQAGVDSKLIEEAIVARKGARNVLPFRYVAAARAAPRYESFIDQALIATVEGQEKLSGNTIILVDVSGSMDAALSSKSDLNRIDAAAVLASIFPAEKARVFTFSNNTVEVPYRKGMAGVDAISKSQYHSGTMLGEALKKAYSLQHDRLIVITDEQSHDAVRNPPTPGRNYLINVASYKNGVGYRGNWTHIDGFSENVINYIREYEKL